MTLQNAREARAMPKGAPAPFPFLPVGMSGPSGAAAAGASQAAAGASQAAAGTSAAHPELLSDYEKCTKPLAELQARAGAAARGGGPHAKKPLKATKATTMLLPAAATAGLWRPRPGRGGAAAD
ncbi:hypothetical protein T492DRAFT_890388 [Pavlovales sp. CCMP2436]|nr:hypothetical protein T492DRAFT_890388 [Pavlovales sp. CCMP2436]